MATKAQIITTAAKNLGILGEGEVLPSYETDDLDQAYTETYNILQALNLTTWAITAAIPDQYAHPVGMLVAGRRAVEYQIPDNRYMRIVSEGWGQNQDGTAIKLLRRLQARPALGQTQIENY